MYIIPLQRTFVNMYHALSIQVSAQDSFGMVYIFYWHPFVADFPSCLCDS